MSNVTAKKAEANRTNALESTGPNNTSTPRFNAVKHGLRAEGITELDPDYTTLAEDVKHTLNPVDHWKPF